MKFFCFLMLVAGTAFANDAALLHCRSIPEASERLACYDGLIIAIDGGKQAAQAQSPLQNSGQFGAEPPPNKAEPQAIESQIPGRFEGWQPNSRIQLGNGQVWQVSDGSSADYALQDPKVIVRRGMLGAYYLEIEGANRAPRVKRVK